MKNFTLLIMVTFCNFNFAQEIKSLVAPNTLFNDSCSNVLIVYVQDLPYTFTETNGDQATNNAGFIGACGNAMNDGEWFRVYGTGGKITINLTNITPTYDPQIAVFSGSCSNLVCLATEDAGNNGGNETISFLTTRFEPYYVNIGHYSDFVDLPEGNFTINIVQAFGNDDCISAYNVDGGFSDYSFNYSETLGNQATNNAGFVTACGQGTNDGEWFKFTGTGKSMFIELQNVGANYDPRLSVYSGSCSNLTCVDTIDQGISGQNENLLIPTTFGVVYYINIGYYSPNNDFLEGNFKLFIDTRLPNDECTTPKLITSLPFDYTETEYFLVTPSLTTTPCDGNNKYDHWFQYTGDGSAKNVSLTVLTSGFYPRVVIYTGTCDNLTCYYVSDNGFSQDPMIFATPASTIGQNYLMRIFDSNSLNGIGAFPGSFRIQVDNIPLSNQDFEKNAIKISFVPNPSNGEFKIETQQEIKSATAFDLLGKEIKLTNNGENYFQLTNQVPGIYFIKVAFANGAQTTQKLIIQ
jgi:Secretion system C-terminal sorting domain